MIVKNDKSIGCLAVERGLMTQAQLDEAIQAQQHIAQVGCHKRLGEIILEKGLLTSKQMLELLKLQRARYQQRYFSGYQLHATLGEGGMGRVYWATRMRDGLRVALKVLSKDAVASSGSVERFYRESQVALTLRHPNLIHAYEYGCHKGRYYLALEFVRGVTVSQQLVEQGPLAISRALLVARQILLALGYLAKQGIAHRDVKPSNIMLTVHNQAKLLDYGLARQVTRSGQRITLTGQIVGTPDYMAPEQIMGQAIDERCDIFALGATLYSMVTARAPLEDLEGSNAIFMGHLTGQYPDPRQYNAEISDHLAAVITRAMALDPDSRYPNAEAMITDIDRLLAGETPRAATPTDTALVTRQVSRISRHRQRLARGLIRGMTGQVLLWTALASGLVLAGVVTGLMIAS
jgi:serine/threonine-protein kinase